MSGEVWNLHWSFYLTTVPLDLSIATNITHQTDWHVGYTASLCRDFPSHYFWQTLKDFLGGYEYLLSYLVLVSESYFRRLDEKFFYRKQMVLSKSENYYEKFWMWLVVAVITASLVSANSVRRRASLLSRSYHIASFESIVYLTFFGVKSLQLDRQR